MHPSAEALADIAAVVDGSVTTDEMIAKVKARYRHV
ncbi:antitoxin VbhA family protein [Microbacterium testaceum]